MKDTVLETLDSYIMSLCEQAIESHDIGLAGSGARVLYVNGKVNAGITLAAQCQFFTPEVALFLFQVTQSWADFGYGVNNAPAS